MNYCRTCSDDVSPERWALGRYTCLRCGEADARAVRHCAVPMPKSNYILVTDPALLKGLNSSHKGGLT